jgi:hypothetical protein
MNKNNKAHSRSCPLASLLSAALALPIVAIPVSVAAQDAPAASTTSLLPPGAVVGLRSLWYREDGNRMKVTEPVLWFKSPIGESWEVAASATVDMVSGASPIIVANTTGKPVQIYTGASITDRRKAGDASLTRKYGALNENTLGVSFATSNEKDYDSKAYGLNATFDFNERNTTLALGLGKRNDRVMSVTDPTLNEPRDAKEYLIGVTQLIDRRTLVQSNLTVTKLTGYLDDPYKRTFSFYRDGALPPASPVILSRDLRPDSRTQIAWLTRGKRALPEMGAIVSAEYRYYRDDWGIRSHTLAGTWLQTVNDTWQIEAGLRYYSQTAADFYRAEITQRPAPRYTSSDQRIGAFGAFEPSVRVIVKLTEQLSWDVGFARYMQRGAWKLNGGGSPAFESLNARSLTSGLVYRF